MKEILNNLNPIAIARGENGIKRIIYTVIGVFFIGFGISIFSYSNLGVDAFTSFTMGASGKIGMGLGTVQMAINFIIIILVALLAKRLIGLGTVLNMVLVGYICQFFIFVYGRLLPTPEGMIIRLLLMLLGTLLLSLGCAFYFVADLGVSPYDATGVILEQYTKIPYKWARVITDVIITLVGFLLAGPIGVGTIVSSLCIGPFISFFKKNVAEKLVNGK